MSDSLKGEGFCKCSNPTKVRDNCGTCYCRRCNRDIEEVNQGLTDFEEGVKASNLDSLQEAALTSDIDLEPMAGDTSCPFCYANTAWSYPSGDDGEKEDEAYCGDCDIAFKVATGTFVAGSGDPKTIKAKHSKPSRAEEKDVKIIKNGKDAEEATKFEKHYCVKDHKAKGFSIICQYCPATFTEWGPAIAHETVDLNGAPKSKNSYYTAGIGGYSGYASCSHNPTHIINGGEEGWNVFAGNRWGCSDKLGDYDLVLNLTGDPVRRSVGHVIPIAELKKWQGKSPSSPKYTEVVLDWPDMGVVNLGKDFWAAFTDYVRKEKKKVVVFCVGGHGRTGTALAVLLHNFLGWSAEESIKWVRKNYCNKTIETVSQMEYVYEMTGEEVPANLKARKGQGFGGKKAAITTVGGNDDGLPPVGEHWGGQTKLL